jgi:hypothetical protein
MTTKAEERALCFAFGLVARCKPREDEPDMLQGLRAALKAVSEERGNNPDGPQAGTGAALRRALDEGPTIAPPYVIAETRGSK